MNFAQLQASTRIQLNALTAVYYTDQDIRDALNEGYAEMADITEFYERQWNLTLLKNRTYYDLATILPDTLLTPRRCFNVTTNRWLIPTDPRDQDYHTYVQWELTQGEPEKYLMRGNWWLGVFPKKPTESTGLRLYGTAIPVPMSDSTDVPQFPVEFHSGLIEFAVSDLLAQSRDSKLALEHWKSFLVYAADLKAFVEGRAKLAGIHHL